MPESHQVHAGGWHSTSLHCSWVPLAQSPALPGGCTCMLGDASAQGSEQVRASLAAALGALLCSGEAGRARLSSTWDKAGAIHAAPRGPGGVYAK